MFNSSEEQGTSKSVMYGGPMKIIIYIYIKYEKRENTKWKTIKMKELLKEIGAEWKKHITEIVKRK